MWVKVGDQLIQTTDGSRVKFRTNISKEILERLRDLADRYDTHVNYLIESGLEAVLAEGVIVYNKDNRPSDRVQYKTTYDKNLLAAVREMAARNGVFVNDLIENSVDFVDIDRCKAKTHRARIECAAMLKN